MRKESGDKTSSAVIRIFAQRSVAPGKRAPKNKHFWVKGSEDKVFNVKNCKDRGSPWSSHADNDFGEKVPRRY